MAHTTWKIAGGVVIGVESPRIMAIVNATPDSFSDGGAHLDPGAAAAFAARAVAEGAAILDVGGESTRPGARAVSAEEQIARVVPVIAAIRGAGIGAAISVDTTSAAVARAALDAGAGIVNDVSAGMDDAAMLPVVAERGAGVVLMHRRAHVASGAADPDYSAEGGVVAAVRTFLSRAAERAMAAGIGIDHIALDPGLGFGKSVAQNYALIGRMDALMDLGFAVVSAASRKSFLGAATGQDVPAERVEASVAVTVAHALAGVRLFRVHDVAAHARALAVVERIAAAGREPAGE